MTIMILWLIVHAGLSAFYAPWAYHTWQVWRSAGRRRRMAVLTRELISALSMATVSLTYFTLGIISLAIPAAANLVGVGLMVGSLLTNVMGYNFYSIMNKTDGESPLQLNWALSLFLIIILFLISVWALANSAVPPECL